MDIYYITFALFPTKYAHAIQIIKMCEGLANNSHNVTLVIPDNRDSRFKKNIEPYNGDLCEFYGVTNNFNILRVKLPQYRGWKYIFPYLALRKIKKGTNTLIYTRHTEIAAVSCLYKFNSVIEYHHVDINGRLIQKIYAKLLYRSVYLKKIILISSALKEAFVKLGFPANLLFISPDAASNSHSHQKVNFSDVPSIGYVGSLYNGKGMEIIIKLAALMPQHKFHVVGGQNNDVIRWQATADDSNLINIIFHGFVPKNQVDSYINAFDICLLPNQKNVAFLGESGINISAYTSPLKMFDYMAHGKAIIASDLPVLREVLNDHNAILCDPENVQQWVDAINILHANPVLRKKLGLVAYQDFEKNYTWKIRAQRIIDSIQKD